MWSRRVAAEISELAAVSSRHDVSEQRVNERKQEKVSNNRITRESDRKRFAADAANAS